VRRFKGARTWCVAIGIAIGVSGLLILLTVVVPSVVSIVPAAQLSSLTTGQTASHTSTTSASTTVARTTTHQLACSPRTPFNPPLLATLAPPGDLVLDHTRHIVVIVSSSRNTRSTIDSIATFDATTGASIGSKRAVTAPLAAHAPTVILSDGLYMALDERTQRVFVLHQPFAQGASPPSRVDVFDEHSLALLRIVPVGNVARPPVVDEQTGRVFVAGQQSGTVDVLDATTGAPLRRVAVAVAALLPSAPPVVVPGANRVFFAEDTAPGVVAVLDARSGALLRKVVVGLYPQAIAVDPATGHVLVGSQNTVSVLDGRDGTALHTAGVPGSPTGLLIDGTTQRAFVSYADNFKVSMLDALTGRVLRSEIVRADVDALGHLLPPNVRPPQQPGSEQPPTLSRIDERRRWVVVSNPEISDDDAPEPGSAQLATLDSRTGTIIHIVAAQNIWPDAAAVDERTGRAFVYGSSGITMYDISCLTSYYVFADLPQ